MERKTEGMIRPASISFAILMLVVACPAKQPGKNLADLYHGYRVFDPARLAQGQIAIEDANGKFGRSIEIGKLKYSEKALIMLDSADGAPGFTVKRLSEQISRINTPGPLPEVKCSTTWLYNKESVIIDRCVILEDKVMFSSYQQQAGVSLPTKPFARVRVLPFLSDLVFKCRLTVAGEISCQNSCACGGCVTCTFTSKDGSIMRDVQQPARDPDTTTSLPCNSMNQC